MITLELKKEDFADAEVFEGVLDILGIDEDQIHLIEVVRIHINDVVIILRKPDNGPDFDSDDSSDVIGKWNIG